MSAPSPAERHAVSAGRMVREWTESRDDAIRQWREEGGSLREIGDAVGLSHTAIRFICDPAARKASTS